jgi:hypothetical protein
METTTRTATVARSRSNPALFFVYFSKTIVEMKSFLHHVLLMNQSHRVLCAFFLKKSAKHLLTRTYILRAIKTTSYGVYYL